MHIQQYADRLFRNNVAIRELQAVDYPDLFRFLHERSDAKLNRLLFLLDTALYLPNQERYDNGYWFIMPFSRLAQQGAHVAKSDKTWRKTITLFLAIGLIWRKIPTAETANTPYEREAVRYMIEQCNRRAIGFYSFPEYTAEQLRYCEHKAHLWYKNDGNLQDWSKATVIDVFGSTTANRVYADGRRKPKYKLDAERTLISTLSSLLATNSYTTRDELIRTAAATAAEGRDSAVLMYYIRLYGRTWERASKHILNRATARHKRPTDKEKAEYGLATNGWIIVRTGREAV